MKKSLVIRNEINELNRVSCFVEEIGEEYQLAPDLVFSLNLVLEEAVSNIILYAYPKQVDKDIIIQTLYDKQSLIFTITDSGQPFDPTQVADADITLSSEERPIGGLGIFIIRQIMNEVEYQRVDGKNVFTLKKYINK